MRSTFLDFLLHPRNPVALVLSLASFSAAATGLALGDMSQQITGVPLPVLLAALAGAFFARAYGPELTLARAAAVVCGWTAGGCAGAPLLQAATIWALKRYADFELNVPGGFLALAALVISSAAWWAPVVWPFIRARLPAAKGGAA